MKLSTKKKLDPVQQSLNLLARASAAVAWRSGAVSDWADQKMMARGYRKYGAGRTPTKDEMQLYRMLQEQTVRKEPLAVADDGIPALLRAVAEGRREYMRSYSEGEVNPVLREQRRTLEIEALTLEAAAEIAEGSVAPLYGLLPSWRWTDEMVKALGVGG